MHELSITQSIVEIAGEHARDAKVIRVTLEIGKLSLVVPDAIRFCFEICTQGTPLEGAELEIIEIPGRGRCRRCGAEMALADLVDQCACGSLDIEPIAGQDLKIKEMEIA